MVGEAGKHNGLGGGFVPQEARAAVDAALKRHGFFPAANGNNALSDHRIIGSSNPGFALQSPSPWVTQASEEKSKEKQEAARASQEINEAVSKVDAAIAAAGGSAELVKHLSSQRDNLVALKSQLALGFKSGAGLTELLQQVHAATSTATTTIHHSLFSVHGSMCNGDGKAYGIMSP